jgi:hypothetical protein
MLSVKTPSSAQLRRELPLDEAFAERMFALGEGSESGSD